MDANNITINDDEFDELFMELFKKLRGEPYDPDKVKELFEMIETSA